MKYIVIISFKEPSDEPGAGMRSARTILAQRASLNGTMVSTKNDCFTPDRRYMVIRGRLWRLSNPFLDPAEHARLVRELMSARRAVKNASEARVRLDARARVDAAKRALGERGDVWWDDGSPDYNLRPVGDTPYAAWFSTTTEAPHAGAEVLSQA